MCQFYHICFGNLSCQLMTIGTAEGYDTEKHHLRSTISMTLVAKHPFFKVSSYFPLHLYVNSFNINNAFFISDMEVFTQQNPSGNIQAFFWADSAFTGTTVMINGNSFHCQSNTAQTSTTESTNEFIWFCLSVKWVLILYFLDCQPHKTFFFF